MDTIGNKSVLIGRKIVASVFRYIFLIAFSYVLIYPIIYMISNSVKGEADYYNPSVQWLPQAYTLQNIKIAVEMLDFWKALLSTLTNQIVAAFLEVASCAVAAFGLARFNFKGKHVLMGLMILGILIPNAMTIIPSFVNYQNLGLIDTPFVFYLPSILGVGLSGSLFIYIYTQFFKGLPKEIEEAAWVDGAGVWKTFLKIVLPSSGVVFVTVTVFAVIWHWNDYYLAQMFLSSNYPLGVRVSNMVTTITGFLNQHYEPGTKLCIAQILVSGCLLYIAPLIAFYSIIQKMFIASVVTSGIVG